MARAAAGDKYAADIPIYQEYLEASETRTGWTAGAGVEWGLLEQLVRKG